MINFTKILEKNEIKKGQQNLKLLLKVKGERTVKNSKRLPLNISLVIDTSTSMNDYVNSSKINSSPVFAYNAKDYDSNKNINPMFIGDNLNKNDIYDHHAKNNALDYLIRNQVEKNNFSQRLTKLLKVKKSAIDCINLLQNGDFISIVTFSDTVRVVQPAIEFNSITKIDLLGKINSIYASGFTNLYDGWVQGGLEVAKNMSKKHLNRILLLTDGETNIGVTDPSKITETVEGLYKKDISTSTFGVGDHFNEDLLEKIADVSGGNFYYIQDDGSSDFLVKEFQGLNNIIGNSASIKFTSKDNSSTISCLNDLVLSDDKFIIGNISDKELSFLFDVSFKNTAKVGNSFYLGNFTLEYKDSNGNLVSTIINIELNTIKEKDYESQVKNEEVNVQDIILDLAKKQKLAKEQIKNGNRDAGFGLISGAIGTASALSQDARVLREVSAMNTLLADKDSYSNLSMSKMLNSMSYNTRTSKN